MKFLSLFFLLLFVLLVGGGGGGVKRVSAYTNFAFSISSSSHPSAGDRHRQHDTTDGTKINSNTHVKSFIRSSITPTSISILLTYRRYSGFCRCWNKKNNDQEVEEEEENLVANDDEEHQQRRRHRRQQHEGKKTKKRNHQRIPILMYRDNWVCVNKPAGMSVHRNHNNNRHNKKMNNGQVVVVDVAKAIKRQLSRKVHPVHRLDHRTSGALLFAFDAKTCGQMHATLKSSTTKKRYIALLRGDWKQQQQQQQQQQLVTGSDEEQKGIPTTITIDTPLIVKGIMKNAVTVFHYIASCNSCPTPPPPPSSEARGTNATTVVDDNNVNTRCTLVLVELPTTGRTHQIRRHAASSELNMPVIGDTQHGDSKVNRYWRTNFNLNRLALHCSNLKLELTNDDGRNNINNNGEGSESEIIDIVAPIPLGFLNVLQHHDELWKGAVQGQHRNLFTTEYIDIRGGTLGIKKDWQIEKEERKTNERHRMGST